MYYKEIQKIIGLDCC